jgi:hypothetical protein
MLGLVSGKTHINNEAARNNDESASRWRYEESAKSSVAGSGTGNVWSQHSAHRQAYVFQTGFEACERAIGLSRGSPRRIDDGGLARRGLLLVWALIAAARLWRKHITLHARLLHDVSP